ncbi:MAG: TetR/AcrR family transcriptional regulator [Hyphomicrobiaceae bacterium]
MLARARQTDLETAPRPAGSRSADATRARILDAARIEFVTEGLNGARVDRIAARSRTNKNLIYHHFGNKEGLYLRVLEDIYGALRAHQNDAEVANLSPIEGMKVLVGNTFDHFVATPDLIRLMSIENIHFARHLKQSASVKQLYAPLLATIQSLLARGEASGSFRANVDPVDLYLSISGLAYFYLSNQFTLSWLLDRDLVGAARLAERRQHIVEMILAYLQDGAPKAGRRVRGGRPQSEGRRAAGSRRHV